MLHELDNEMEQMGSRFVRYADDFSIYCKTKTEAHMMGNRVLRILKRQIKTTHQQGKERTPQTRQLQSVRI